MFATEPQLMNVPSVDESSASSDGHGAFAVITPKCIPMAVSC